MHRTFLFAATLMACQTTPGTADTDDDTPQVITVDTGDDALVPEEGQWVFGDFDVLTDSCTAGFPGAGGWDITGASADGFTINWADFDASQTCGLAEEVGSCENWVTTDERDDGAVLTSTITLGISFDNQAQASGTLGYTIDCSGETCDAVAIELGYPGFPCVFDSTYSANYGQHTSDG